MDLLENEQERKYQSEQGEGEPVATPEETVAGFWQGRIDIMDASGLVAQTQGSEREAITSAARALVALCPVRVAASEARKSRTEILITSPAQKMKRERETDPLEEHLTRV